MQDTNIDYQYKYREILQTSTSFEEIKDRINILINYSGAHFSISSVHYVKYPVEGFKIFCIVTHPFPKKETSYSEFKNFLRGFSNTAGFLLFEFHDIPLIAEKFKSIFGEITRFSALVDIYTKACEENHEFELNEIQKESGELRSRLNFLVQKENRILQEIQNDTNQFINEHIKAINGIYDTEEHSIKFLTENPTMTTLRAILQEIKE